MIVHHVDVCSNPNDVGTEYSRTFEFKDDRLILGTPPVQCDGVIVELKLEWQAYPEGRLKG